MTNETKADLEAQVERLQSENENLRGQLAAAGARRPVAAGASPAQFVLSEGQRLELELTGQTTGPGGQPMTVDDARTRLAESENQSGVQIADGARPLAPPTPVVERPAVVGVTHVYPSIRPGVIDPAVAGQPGISGPTVEG